MDKKKKHDCNRQVEEIASVHQVPKFGILTCARNDKKTKGVLQYVAGRVMSPAPSTFSGTNKEVNSLSEG